MTSTARSKVTVAATIRCVDMAMASTEAATDVVRDVMGTLYTKHRDEIDTALKDAGVTKVTISMIAY